MKKYINADLFRLYRRIPRLILLFVIFVIIAILFWPEKESESTIIDLIDVLEGCLKYVPVYIGFVELLYVFGDDFAGKTAQIAIGTGIKRKEVILSKWLEVIIVTAVDVVIITAIGLILSVISKHTLPGELVIDIFAHAVVAVLATGAYMALVFPIMFMMQNITVAFLIYIMLASGAINKILGYVLSLNKFIRTLALEHLTLTNCLNVFRSRMILGTFQFESIVGIILYIALALYITYILYKKRELEF